MRSWSEQSVQEIAEACALGYGGACMELEDRASQRDRYREALEWFARGDWVEDDPLAARDFARRVVELRSVREGA